MNAPITTPRERPLLMSGPLVVATLQGRKTRTRRVITPQPPEGVDRIVVERYVPAIVDKFGELQPGPEIFGAYDLSGEWGVRCPYGEPGDRLWVRETWRPDRMRDGEWDCDVFYAADGVTRRIDENTISELDGSDWIRPKQADRGNVPGIHMPRWASRLLLEVTEIRVERLHEITEDDAQAEGIVFDGRWWLGAPHPIKGHAKVFPTAVQAFQSLWNAINGKRCGCAWDDNPHVWVVGFEVIR